MRFFSTVLTTAAVLLAGGRLASAQLNTTVGPTTALSAKQTKICSVLDYGGSVGSSDIGPAILSAFTVYPCPHSHCMRSFLHLVQNCVTKNTGSTLYVPTGNYNMQTWVTLNHGTKWAFRLDGFITRTCAFGSGIDIERY
jgi:rhamnogalacturonan hydrolase